METRRRREGVLGSAPGSTVSRVGLGTERTGECLQDRRRYGIEVQGLTDALPPVGPRDEATLGVVVLTRAVGEDTAVVGEGPVAVALASPAEEGAVGGPRPSTGDGSEVDVEVPSLLGRNQRESGQLG